LGIIDPNPTAAIDTEVEELKEEEKEILLCLRPILEGGTVGEELSSLHQKNKAINKDENSCVVDVDVHLTGTKSVINHDAMKIKTFTPEGATLFNFELLKKTSTGTHDFSNASNNDEQEKDSVV
jgi:hypothetical protein